MNLFDTKEQFEKSVYSKEVKLNEILVTNFLKPVLESEEDYFTKCNIMILTPAASSFYIKSRNMIKEMFFAILFQGHSLFSY